MASCGFETELFIACYFCFKSTQIFLFRQLSNLLYAVLAYLAKRFADNRIFQFSEIYLLWIFVSNFKILRFNYHVHLAKNPLNYLFSLNLSFLSFLSL